MLVVLSGPVGSGKTTLCQRLAQGARDQAVLLGGILAPAIIENGLKVGINAVDLGRQETRLMARIDRDLGGERVGPYSFCLGVFGWAASVCERALQGEGLVFVDEIGRLELERAQGLAPVLPILLQPRAGNTVVVVRESLTPTLVDLLAEREPRLVRFDPECRESAWESMQQLLLNDSPA